MVVCNWELAEARKKDALDRARVRGEQLPPELLAEERGMHSSIEAEVKRHLQGKTYGELEALQSQIESQMQSGTAKVVEYWEALLKRLHIFKAKVKILLTIQHAFEFGHHHPDILCNGRPVSRKSMPKCCANIYSALKNHLRLKVTRENRVQSLIWKILTMTEKV